MILLALLLASPQATDPAIAARVQRVLQRAPVLDGHNDLPWEIRERHEAKVESIDLTQSTAALPFPMQTDIPRLKRGGVGYYARSDFVHVDTGRVRSW